MVGSLPVNREEFNGLKQEVELIKTTLGAIKLHSEYLETRLNDLNAALEKATDAAQAAQNTANDAVNKANSAQGTANDAVNRANSAQNTANQALAEPSISLGWGNLLGCGLSDAFSYNGRTMGHYSLTWGSDSWQRNGATAWFSGWGGIKLFTGGVERFSINAHGEIRYHVSLHHSSREFKNNIVDFSVEEAVQIVEKLNPVSYTLKTDEDKRLHFGFIAEDVPQPIASDDRKAISNDNILAVLTKVVKEQQKTIKALQKDIQSLKA